MTDSNMALCFKTTKKGARSRRNDFFMENNRLLLEELHTCFDGKSNPIRIFSEKEIIEATKNYDPDQFLGYINVYTWYKGCYEDRLVIIKKFEYWPGRKQCATEIAVLSQIKHKNVVELLGCCLETELPILVFGNCFHETLAQHIYHNYSNSRDTRVGSWESKLRIASDIAYAITYIHSFTCRPIIHRDITADNIFLDQQGTAKLANFSLCIPLPVGKTDIETTKVEATHGYLAPEYYSKGRVSEKTDVFRFGVVLFEILARQRFFSPCGEEVIYLPCHVESLLRDGLLSKMVEQPTIKEGEGEGEGNMIKEQLQRYVELANKCINVEEDERPMMKEVAKELWSIRKC